MDFYSEFSKNYDKIFPLNSKKLELIDNTFKVLKEKRENIKLLDVGCGTGSYALALAERGYKVQAVDLDAEMISLAESKKVKAKADVEFYRLGMLNLKKKFKSASFDGIYIIGNVLVHLRKKEIKEFLVLAAELLKENGKIFIQLVNYQRILELNLDGLPTIYSKDDSVRFERNYDYNKKENIIYFKTKLIDHFDDKILSENEIELYPLCKSELEADLKAAGFIVENIYGSPGGDQYRELSSIPLIITANKK
ncbi:methyltransferase family protein [Halanaerobium saccharolyticum]|uniref:Methyltransferase family protein n=1 Tax=Halanaerobium saccharolyticum TaxID=43595 RepID=A0A4R7YMU4_9FIRM|nr:class I SAM-dependent methyltransferase [Halanaerobium saccharolyticum]RAK04861.1 methyltransferase family protein [Halanaerobium saccharolyticum]TDV98258.1 methyltransferase family protein [Halanaerobium saccharolyticum]TDX51105.1 methyltransferase family protein [Halanaerobium saccharolyticum]